MIKVWIGASLSVLVLSVVVAVCGVWQVGNEIAELNSRKQAINEDILELAKEKRNSKVPFDVVL